MSIDCSTYVGPYFRCTPTRGKVDKTMRTCPKTDCKEHRREKLDKKMVFCQQCGNKITDVTFQVDALLQHCQEIAHEDLGGELTTVHYEEGEGAKHHIFIPNVNRDKPHVLHVDNRGQTAYIELPDPAISQDKLWLETKFAKEYEHLQSRYGADNTVICWGVLCWMH